MKITDKLPKPVTWFIRIIGWTVSLAIIWGLFSFYANMRAANNIVACLELQLNSPARGSLSTIDAAKELVACLDKRSGFLEKFKYAPAKKALLSLPSVPFQYIGVWTASRADGQYRVTLMDDSRFVAEPVGNGTTGTQITSGSWGARDGKMIWLYDDGRIWPPDINPITDISETSFSLYEADRSTTHYKLVQRLPSMAYTSK